jgi:hypothetical protein
MEKQYHEDMDWVNAIENNVQWRASESRGMHILSA